MLLCKKLLDTLSNKKYPVISNSDAEAFVSIMVSIIVVNRNGYKHLKTLIPALLEHTKGIIYELIIVDNASTDKSIAYLQSHAEQFSLHIIQNKQNESFSRANNQAVAIAQGKYLVLLNNDIEPLQGWLHHLIHSAQSIPQLNSQLNSLIGSVGARLVYPYIKPPLFKNPFKKYKKISCRIQHAGIAYQDEGAVFRPYNVGKGKAPSDASVLLSEPKSALTAACLLIPKDVYLEVGGLDEAYNYGGEDVDFGLKLLKAGYVNYYCADAVLFHHEFGTQSKEKRQEGAVRRENNLNILQARWFHTIRQSYWHEKLMGSSHLYAETPLTLAITVTDHGENVTAGDYFTAQELASALQSFGWKIIYLSRKKDEWYDIPESVDVLLNLLDAYDLSLIPERKKRLLTIAWARNWFDRWCGAPSFNDYDCVLASSQIACDYIAENSRKKALLFPLATEPKRFAHQPECKQPAKYKSDICFTGSYWNTPRDIMQALSEEALQKYRVHIYGANWEQFEKFKPYNKGFIAYEELPCVYHHTKIVIDDANHVTKPYGSVNSRVFDALMSGALVVSNGVKGSDSLFSGELPTYETRAELDQLLDFYLSDVDARQAKVSQLRQIIVDKHSYTHRAETLRGTLSQRFLSTAIAIKIPAPSWERSFSWGDYHMAVLLQRQLENIGYRVLLQVLPEWDNDKGFECDVAIVFRGLSRYTVKAHQLNIMWNISHPDKVSLEEYEEYDQVFIASDLWAKKIAEQVSTPVVSMLQCTDPERFHEPDDSEKKAYQQQLLFIGNSRQIHRKVLKDLIPAGDVTNDVTNHATGNTIDHVTSYEIDYDLAVYGRHWDKLIPLQYIKGDHIQNDELYRHYGAADILLNDHWDDMREQGFVSNRIFDGLACGAFIITDRVCSMGDLQPFVHSYDNSEDLRESIDYYLAHPEERFLKAQAGMKYIRENHTFKERAKQFSESISLLLARKK